MGDREAVQDVIKTGKPYFGIRFSACQGARRRHAYMQALVKLLASEGIKEPSLLEVGSWAGGSAVTWGKALQKYCSGGKVLCADHWKPYFDLSKNTQPVYRKMDSAARGEAIFDLFLHNVRTSGIGDRVLILRGDSKVTLPLLKPGTFDLAFIDASHAYSDVLPDIKTCGSLVRDGGIICGDDLELQLDECPLDYTRKLADEQDYVPHPTAGKSYHPGVTLAVDEVMGRVSCWEGLWAMRKEGAIWKQFKLKTPPPGDPPHLNG